MTASRSFCSTASPMTSTDTTPSRRTSPPRVGASSCPRSRLRTYALHRRGRATGQPAGGARHRPARRARHRTGDACGLRLGRSRRLRRRRAPPRARRRAGERRQRLQHPEQRRCFQARRTRDRAALMVLVLHELGTGCGRAGDRPLRLLPPPVAVLLADLVVRRRDLRAQRGVVRQSGLRRGGAPLQPLPIGAARRGATRRL